MIITMSPKSLLMTLQKTLLILIFKINLLRKQADSNVQSYNGIA